jgi:hypothetical protein
MWTARCKTWCLDRCLLDGRGPNALSAPGAVWGPRLRPATLGAVDGLVTTFAVVVAGTTADVATNAIVSVAVATMLADAVSMCVGEYLSSQPTVGRREAAIFATTCGASFVCFGALPIAAFATTRRPASATAAFVAALFWLGGARAALSAQREGSVGVVGRLLPLVEVLLLGAVAAGVCLLAALVAGNEGGDTGVNK